MAISWKDLFIISLTILVLGLALTVYGVIVRSESIIISASILILFPIPFVILSHRGFKKGDVNPSDLYGNAIIALITISIISLIGYFLFATASGKAVSLAIFIGTVLSLLIDYINKRKSTRRERKVLKELDKSDDSTLMKQEDMVSEK